MAIGSMPTSRNADSIQTGMTVLGFTALLLGLSVPGVAQTPRRQPRVEKAPSTTISPWISATGEFDNNVFLLTSRRKNSLNNLSSIDAANGRFNGMKHAEDLIAHFEGGLSFETRGMGGRPFAFVPSVEYNHYTRNTERSSFAAAVALQQALPQSSRVRLSATYAPDYFAKNYLIDAVDENGDRSISSSERRYAAARHAETKVDLAYRRRLRKRTKSSPVNVQIELGAGYFTRAYGAPFTSRNLSGPTLAFELGIDPSRRAELTLGYQVGMISADPALEVLILDEPAVGADLNNNGRKSDLAVRTVQSVDRSRIEHEARISSRVEMTRRTSLRGTFGFRLRNYNSDQQFDVSHRNRRDTRAEIGGDLVTKLARSLRFTLGSRFTRQFTDRSFDPDLSGDAEDYARIRAYAGVRYEFR